MAADESPAEPTSGHPRRALMKNGEFGMTQVILDHGVSARFGTRLIPLRLVDQVAVSCKAGTT